MKKLVTLLLAAAAVAAFAANAFAVNLISEGFNYPNGNLVGNGGWANFSGTGTDIQVVNGRAVGDMNAAPDDSRTFAAQTGVLYTCFEVVINNPTPTTAPILNHFYILAASASTFFGRVYVAPVGSGGAWTLATSWSSVAAGAAQVTLWNTPLTYGTRYYVVVKIDPVAKTSTMWVNPSSEASTSVTNTGTLSAAAVTMVGLRQSSSAAVSDNVTPGSAKWTFSVDNIGVGTSFVDACAQVTPAQTSTWGRVKSMYR